MKCRRTTKKKSFLRPVLIGFSVFYVLSMLMVTVIMKENFDKQALLQTQSKAEDLSRWIYDVTSRSEMAKIFKDETQFERFLYTVLAESAYHDTESIQFSGAIYDQTKEGHQLIAYKTTIFRYPSDGYSYTYPLENYFSEEEFKDYFFYIDKHTHDTWTYVKDSWSDKQNYERKLNAKIRFSDQELVYIWIEEWNKAAGQTEPVTIWQWSNSQLTSKEHAEVHANLDTIILEGIEPDYLEIPGGNLAENLYDGWKSWKEDMYLSKFSTRCNFADLDAKRYGNCSVTLPIYRADVPEQTYTLKLHASYHPWIESMETLLPFYVCALIFVIVCIIKIITTTHKTYHQQQLLEQNRRDFTNAIAHELKNPLNVIRGFAENLLENTNKEKKDYYLEHIILQTEEMDGLVQEMIQVSKLDSDQLKLAKEPLSLLEICKEQAKKFQPQIDEQKLKLIYSCSDDFRIQGDKIWIEKALWNLISNAISYNCLQGKIMITATENQFTIENTGNQISQEDLPHVFEMLYSSDKSRTSMENTPKHLGMGLYLSKKILDLHNLHISINNTPIGVCVTISKR